MERKQHRVDQSSQSSAMARNVQLCDRSLSIGDVQFEWLVQPGRHLLSE